MDDKITDVLLEHLKNNHIGKRNAASSKTLEAIFNVNGRGIRRYINLLRIDGFPVCSDEAGYYYAASKKELGNTVTRLSNLINEISKARNGLLFSGKCLEEESIVEINIIIRR